MSKTIQVIVYVFMYKLTCASHIYIFIQLLTCELLHVKNNSSNCVCVYVSIYMFFALAAPLPVQLHQPPLTWQAAMPSVPFSVSAESVDAFLSMEPNQLVGLALQQLADFKRLSRDSRQHVSYTHILI